MGEKAPWLAYTASRPDAGHDCPHLAASSLLQVCWQGRKGALAGLSAAAELQITSAGQLQGSFCGAAGKASACHRRGTGVACLEEQAAARGVSTG